MEEQEVARYGVVDQQSLLYPHPFPGRHVGHGEDRTIRTEAPETIGGDIAASVDGHILDGAVFQNATVSRSTAVIRGLALFLVEPGVGQRVVREDLAVIGVALGVAAVEDHERALTSTSDEGTGPPSGADRHLPKGGDAGDVNKARSAKLLLLSVHVSQAVHPMVDITSERVEGIVIVAVRNPSAVDTLLYQNEIISLNVVSHVPQARGPIVIHADNLTDLAARVRQHKT